MKTAISIVTCPRPRGAPFLPGTLASIQAQCGGYLEGSEKWVLCDGQDKRVADQVAPHEGWEIHGNPDGDQLHGILWNMWRTFQLAVDRDIDLLVYLEDDVAVCKNAIQHALRTPMPKWAAFACFYDQKELAKLQMPRGLTVQVPVTGRDNRGFWGSQFLVLPKRSLHYLVNVTPMQYAYRFPGPPTSSNYGKTAHSADCILGACFEGTPTPSYNLHYPNLARHTGGRDSVCWPGHEFAENPSYPGDDFDALTLPQSKAA